MVHSPFPALQSGDLTVAENPLMDKCNDIKVDDNNSMKSDLLLEENCDANFKPEVQPSKKVQSDGRCTICASSAVSTTNIILTCAQCAISVHQSCYLSPFEAITAESIQEWVCDACNFCKKDKDEDTEPHSCAYCVQPCDDVVVRVIGPSKMRRDQSSINHPISHVLCRQWDPVEAQDESIVTHLIDWTSSILSCCICTNKTGICIPCRRVGCGRVFHANCASINPSFHLELVINSIGVQHHAYCDRHHQDREDTGDLLTKLTSKSITSIIPRDVVHQLQLIHRRINSFSSLDEVLTHVLNALVEMCQQGFKNEQYNIRHLQVLQMTLDSIPQLRRVYTRPGSVKTYNEWVGDELLRLLTKTFNPPRLISKYAGPICQRRVCEVCHEPFQERQHVFYCMNADNQSHCQHWKCTKRKTSTKGTTASATNGSFVSSSSGTKKKHKPGVPIVQNGAWVEIKQPKNFPNVSDEVVCGVCRAPVDIRAVLASRKEAKGLNYFSEKPPSKFVSGGCYVNLMDARTTMSIGLQANPYTVGARGEFNGSTTTVASSRPAKQLKRGSSTDNLAGSGNADAGVVLVPPRMERISVRRTTRWLACIGHAISLIRAGIRENLSESTEPKTSTEQGEASDKPSCVSGESREVDATGSTVGDSDHPLIKVEVANVESMIQNEGVPSEESLQESMKTDVNKQMIPPYMLSLSIRESFEEAKRIVRPFDSYALDKIESAQRMLEQRCGPGLSILSALVREYTRFMHIKHTRAVEKARNEKRKREQMEQQEAQERERNRIDREEALALKSQMLAVRKKQRQLIKEKTDAAALTSPKSRSDGVNDINHPAIDSPQKS